MATTLLLDPETWDLVLDAEGNIALASEPYALAQDAASAIKTYQGEVYYNTALGVPYYQDILGQWPPLSLVKADMVVAALTVPLVTAARCFITGFTERTISGQVQITDETGNVIAAAGF